MSEASRAHPLLTRSQALAGARDTLSDPAKRSVVDDAILEEQWQKDYEADLAFRRQQAEWRKIRGEALPEDEELLRPGGPGGAGAEGIVRDSWMTELPPERQAKPGGEVPQHVTSFSRRGVTGRGDTSAWTDTPQIAAERQQQLLLGGPGVATLTAAVQQREDRERQAAVIAAVDEYNARNRPKSLMEIHQARNVHNNPLLMRHPYTGLWPSSHRTASRAGPALPDIITCDGLRVDQLPVLSLP